MVQRVRSAVAVDFGTTTSLVARRTGRGPATILNLTPKTAWLPSLVAQHGDGFAIVDPAEALDPARLIRSVKRAITERRQTVPIGGRAGNPEVSADDVIRAILIEVRRRALAAGRSLARVKEIRLGCPAMWDGPQRRRLLEVVSTTGMTVTGESLIEEPIAAGVAWLSEQYLRRSDPVRGRLLVFDMGGGTLDVAVLDVTGGEHPEISVLASRGAAVAGDRFDDAIVADLTARLEREYQCDLERVPRPEAARAELRRLAVGAKTSLSIRKTAVLSLPKRFFGPVPEFQYTRDRLEEVFAPLLAHAEDEIWAALLEARLREGSRDSPPVGLTHERLARDVDFVLLAGGMSHMPAVRERMHKLFPDADITGPDRLDPVEAVVTGLTDTAGYDRINLHRPGFDFVLEWDGGAQRRTLYEAHTPLYEPWQVSSGLTTRLGYERRGRDLGLPHSGAGRLVIVSAAGRNVPLAVDGVTVDRLPVGFGPSELLFKLYCDGQLALTDGRGRQRSLRIERWPVVRDHDDARLQAETVLPPDAG